jgi:hypothetical protein
MWSGGPSSPPHRRRRRDHAKTWSTACGDRGWPMIHAAAGAARVLRSGRRASPRAAATRCSCDCRPPDLDGHRGAPRTVAAVAGQTLSGPRRRSPPPGSLRRRRRPRQPPRPCAQGCPQGARTSSSGCVNVTPNRGREDRTYSRCHADVAPREPTDAEPPPRHPQSRYLVGDRVPRRRADGPPAPRDARPRGRSSRPRPRRRPGRRGHHSGRREDDAGRVRTALAGRAAVPSGTLAM